MRIKQKSIKIILGSIIIGLIGLSFIRLFIVPESLYWDELAIGIDAYSLSETGRDIHGNQWFQAIFPSYGDYKAPVAIWLTTFSVYLFNLSIWSVRFPFFLISLLGLFGMWILTKELINKQIEPKYYRLIQLSTIIFLLTTPWFWHFSGIGFESAMSLALVIWSVYFLLRGLNKSGWLIIISSLLASLSVYTYFSARYITPLFLLGVIFVLFKQSWQKKWWLFLAALLFVVSIQWLTSSPFYEAGQHLRWSADNIITNPDLYQRSAEQILENGNTPLARLVHHRYVYFGTAFFKQYLSHFGLNFLWINGDSNLRHHSGWGGQLLLVSLPMLLIGIYAIGKSLINASKKRIMTPLAQFGLITVLWLLISPITASIPTEVPHASRAIYMLIPITLVFSFSLLWLSSYTKKKTYSFDQLTLIISLLLLVNFGMYVYHYIAKYPIHSAQAWQLGNRFIGEEIEDKQHEERTIVISEVFRLPALAVLFYNPEFIPLVQAQTQAKNSAFDTSWLKGFDRYSFRDGTLEDIDHGSMLLGSPKTEFQDYVQRQYHYPNGEVALEIMYKNDQFTQ